FRGSSPMAAISSSAEEARAGRCGPSAGPSEAPRRAAAPRSPSTARASDQSGPCGRASTPPRVGRLDHARGAQALELVVRKPEQLAVDLAVVLAEARRAASDGARGTREAGVQSLHADRTDD